MDRIITLKVNDSENIVEMLYNVKKSQLFVVFTNYTVYRYADVPISIIVNACIAESVGSFFHNNIKSNYAYEKITTMGYPLVQRILLIGDSPAEVVISWSDADAHVHLNSRRQTYRTEYDALPDIEKRAPLQVRYKEVPVVDLRL